MHLLFIFVCFFVVTTVFADDDFMSMELEDLLQIDVVSATKTQPISIQKAPSIIRVYRREDIRQYGFKNLKDILASIAGIQISEYRAGHQLAWVRGVQARYNNKVLLLIDGVPIRDSYYGHFNIDEMIPMEIIHKIEIINGPGSVLYGANAFSGVINITTQPQGNAFRLSHGSNKTIRANAEFDWQQGYLFADYFETDGFSPQFNSDGKSFKHPQNNENTFLYTKIYNEHLQLGLNLMISMRIVTKNQGNIVFINVNPCMVL